MLNKQVQCHGSGQFPWFLLKKYGRYLFFVHLFRSSLPHLTQPCGQLPSYKLSISLFTSFPIGTCLIIHSRRYTNWTSIFFLSINAWILIWDEIKFSLFLLYMKNLCCIIWEWHEGREKQESFGKMMKKFNVNISLNKEKTRKTIVQIFFKFHLQNLPVVENHFKISMNLQIRFRERARMKFYFQRKSLKI